MENPVPPNPASAPESCKSVASEFAANEFAADLLRAASSSCAVVSEGEGGISCSIVFRRRLAPPAPLAPRGLP